MNPIDVKQKAEKMMGVKDTRINEDYRVVIRFHEEVTPYDVADIVANMEEMGYEIHNEHSPWLFEFQSL